MEKISAYMWVALKNKPEIPKEITPEDIAKVVATAIGKELEVLKMKSRKPEIVQDRLLIVYLIMKGLPKCNHRKIADVFKYDRTTIYHARESIQNRIDTEPEYKARVHQLCDVLYRELNIEIKS